MSGAFRRALLLVSLLACACVTQRVPLMMEVSRDLPSPCWVVMRSGERIMLSQGRVAPDSIVGMGPQGLRVAVARDDVAYVEERRIEAEDFIPLAVLVPMTVVVGFLVVGLYKVVAHPH